MRFGLASILVLACAGCGAEQDFGVPSSKEPPPPPSTIAPIGASEASTPENGAIGPWSWLNPPRGPNTLRGITSSGPRDTWLAGDGGAVLHWDGVQMTTARKGTEDESLYAAWALGPKDVWFGGTRGAAGLLLHYDGSTFTETLPGAVPVSLWGASTNDVWAIVSRTNNATDLVHWDGTAWSAPVPLVGVEGWARLRDVYGLDATRVFAVGDDGVVLRLATSPDGTRVFSRETSDAVVNPFAPSRHYFAVWGPPSSGRVWAAFVASDGFGISVVDTADQQAIPSWRLLQRGLDSNRSSPLGDGEKSACATEVIASLANGPRRRGHLFSGSSFTGSSVSLGLLSTVLLDDSSSCVNGRAALWRLGSDSSLSAEVNGIGGISPAYADATQSPHDSLPLGLAFDGREIVVAGSAGAFFQTPPLANGLPSTASILAPAEPGVLSTKLTAVAAVSADEAWGAAEPTRNKRAPLLHFRGGFWGSVPGLRGDVGAVSFANDALWAAGWTERVEPNGASGTSGFIVQGNGASFQQYVVDDCDSLSSIVGVGPGEAWAVGLGAPYDWTLPSLCIVHVTPSGVTRVPTPEEFVARLVNFQGGSEDWERYIDNASVTAAGPDEVYIFARGKQLGFGVYANLTKNIRSVLRWNGTSFSTVLDAPDLVVGSSFGGSNPPLLARGRNDLLLGAGGLMHFDGKSWSPLSLPSASSPTALAALDAGQQLAIFDEAGSSRVRALQGGVWATGLRVPVSMKALSRASDGAVWMVGAGGATARARRVSPLPRH